MADAGIRLLSRLAALRGGKAFRASRPFEGNAAFMTREEGLWWAWKFYHGPIEEPEPGSGLEEFFRGQDLDFARLPPGAEDFVKDASMTLGAGGDILVSPDLCPGTMTCLWDEVGDFLFGTDLACANLETPVAPSSPPGYLPKSVLGPMALNSSPEVFDVIRGRTAGREGLAFLSTANNHCLDQGEAGLLETLDFLDSRACAHAGTARSPGERDRVVMLERHGIKVAFVSWTFALNWKSLPEGKDYLANHARINRPETELSPIASQVAAARAAGADAVVACLHWSLEFESWPVRAVAEMGRRIAELGVDVIIGNHPHGIQPIERHSWSDGANGATRECLIMYALGDLITVRDKLLPDSHLGLLVRLTLEKGRCGGRVLTRIGGLEVLPTYLFPRMHGDRCEDFRLLDLRKLAAALRQGRNGYGLSRRQARDVPRLEALMERVLGPALEAGGAGAGGGEQGPIS